MAGVLLASQLQLPVLGERYNPREGAARRRCGTFTDEDLHYPSEVAYPHLLLGNGFSIACRPDIFLYGKLFERADFGALSGSARQAFSILGTTDFERVIKALKDSAALLQSYVGIPTGVREQLLADAEGLKEVLVQSIASSHPEHPFQIEEAEYAACRGFLSNFQKIYTLNYDLLLYWVQMHVEPDEEPDADDGFRKPDYDAPYVTWEPQSAHSQKTYYLHGALHLFDSGTELQKFTWINTKERLIDQTRAALTRGMFPLFVSEGTSAEKFEKIRHNDYLAKGYRSFAEIGGTLFIHGHSLAENDEHYLRCIEMGKVRKLFVGLHGDPDSASNLGIIRRAVAMPSRRRRKVELEVLFYDTATAHVWG